VTSGVPIALAPETDYIEVMSSIRQAASLSPIASILLAGLLLRVRAR
jgi:hypothetical protein